MIRLFVCVWVPKNIIKELVKLQNELEMTRIKTKFVERDNFHATVTFIGNVNENEIDEIKVKLDECLKNTSEFHVNLTGLKIIPNESHIRVIGVSVKGLGMENLIKNVGKCIGGSFHEESKITICRVKSVSDKTLLKKFIEKNRNVNLGYFHVKNVTLVKSILKKEGPEYVTVYKVGLKENEGKFTD